MAFDFGAGLSTAGAAVSQFAGTAALEQQKAELENQKVMLADKLAGERQDKQNVFTGERQDKQFAHESGEKALDRTADAPVKAAQIASLAATTDKTRAQLSAGQAIKGIINGGDAGSGGATGVDADVQKKFIDTVRPYAEAASKKTGVDPRIIIAQAALESDWGRAAPGNNYLGIKGDGPNAQMRDTTEQGPNGPYKTKASFKTYDNPAASFDDYAKTISDSRYNDLRNGKDLDAQIQALGRSGYATDSKYGEKVGSIARSLGGATGGSSGLSMDERIQAEAAGGGDVAQVLEARERDKNRAATALERADALVPPDVRASEWFTKASPEQKNAYLSQLAIKAGMPPWMAGMNNGGKDSGDGSTPPAGAPGASPTGAKADVTGDAYSSMPKEAQGTVKAMIEGRLPVPTSFALAKPYWQGMMQYAQSVDPNFDATTWTSRNATRKDFTSGKAAAAVTALNTALGHAGTLVDAFDKMSNTSFPAVNAIWNNVRTQFGSSNVTNAEQARDALAAEARRVFSASGGGNLTELQEWQKNFPINGSLTQQKDALKQFTSLLESRVDALADQYNRGMGRTADPLSFLEPKAKAAYMRLSGEANEPSQGYQTGKPPGGGASTNTPQAAPLPLGTNGRVDFGKLQKGITYTTPLGNGVFDGQGFTQP